MAASHVFDSHSSSDDDVVCKLREALAPRGVERVGEAMLNGQR